MKKSDVGLVNRKHFWISAEGRTAKKAIMKMMLKIHLCGGALAMWGPEKMGNHGKDTGLIQVQPRLKIVMMERKTKSCGDF